MRRVLLPAPPNAAEGKEREERKEDKRRYFKSVECLTEVFSKDSFINSLLDT